MKEPFRRPDPDALIASLKKDEHEQARGKLKIFLGYVAGVGKTYAMLEAAHQRLEEGVDVAVGIVETHGRKETEALLRGLEVIPRKLIDYRGTQLYEMDLDAILTRHPGLVLVDELAHTNGPESRHPKRYQDVEEILKAGIDVYTTINIQHLESLKDVVQQITGVTVREGVPDRLLDEAHEIELIDLPTDELLKRLQDGKVYVSDQAMRALELFFRKGNLTALRELSLRRAANRVDDQMLDYMQTRAIPGPWPAGEHILVCLSSHLMGEQLIRAGRRLADDLKTDWYVLYVETSGHLHMLADNRTRLQRNLWLAEELGAQVVNISAESVARAVIEFAGQHNITKIVAGKPLRSRWDEFLHGSVIDQIIRDSGKIDVYIVSGETGSVPKGHSNRRTSRFSLRRYLLSLGLVLLMTLIGFPLRPILDPTNMVMLFLVAVVISAVFLGREAAIFASVISVLAFDYFFVDPRLTFTVSDTQYLLTFTGLLLVGLIISNFAALLHDQVDKLRRREQQTQAVNTLSKELTSAISLSQVLEAVARNVGEMFDREVVIFLPKNEGLYEAVSTLSTPMGEDEEAVAIWAFKNGQPAGRGTDTLPDTSIRYIPLVTAHGVIGVLGVKSTGPQNQLSLDQRTLLEGFANLSALAIERASLGEKVAQTEMLRNTEKLQSALLNSISHEFRTPLASITGVLSSLGESEKAGQPEYKLDPETSLELIESATQQAQQLNRLVENLLDMTRLEAGALHLNLNPNDLHDCVTAVVNRFSARSCNHEIRVHLPEDLPLVCMDPVLIGQVLVNLLDNACKYSPAGNPIEVSARVTEPFVEIAIRDQGVGIPPEDLERIFDKFYRVQRQNRSSGTGLGLSICRGIVEAHSGKIWALNNAGGGATFRFILPIEAKG